MARSPMFKVTLIFAALVLVAIVALVRSAMRSYSELCEVCITFGGRTACREAYGRSRDEAVRTATDNACAQLASGMTDSVRCTNTPPDRVTCQP